MKQSVNDNRKTLRTGRRRKRIKRDLNIYVVGDEIFLSILFVGPT